MTPAERWCRCAPKLAWLRWHCTCESAAGGVMKTIAIGLFGVLLLSSISSGQAGAGWPHAWTHAYVSRIGNDVFITYLRADGCIDHKLEPDQARAFSSNTLARNETLA